MVNERPIGHTIVPDARTVAQTNQTEIDALGSRYPAQTRDTWPKLD